MTASSSKRTLGQYYTLGNPFGHPAFLDWAQQAGLPQATVLEPFAGANSLVLMLQQAGLCREWRAFDIHPGAPDVVARDTFADFPRGYQVAITNPPYLAKNSAKRRGLAFPSTTYDDLYKHALALTLAHTPWVAAIVPDSLFTAGLFHSRALAFVSLTQSMFADTDHPVCLALFGPSGGNPDLWMGNTRVGRMDDLAQHLPAPSHRYEWTFNDPQGLVGLYALDSPKSASISFVRGKDIDPGIIKPSSRAITRISSPHLAESDLSFFLDQSNRLLENMRANTKDVFLTSFKGLREDGMYRRRMDFSTARALLDAAASLSQL